MRDYGISNSIANDNANKNKYRLWYDMKMQSEMDVECLLIRVVRYAAASCLSRSASRS